LTEPSEKSGGSFSIILAGNKIDNFHTNKKRSKMKKEWIMLLTGFSAGIVGSCQNNKDDNNEKSSERLNILWITTEDMSARLGCYGDPIVSTPNIDRLASEGILFNHVYSVSGVCSPSRAALITGMYPNSFGAQHMRTLSRTAAIDQITDPELLVIPVYEAVPPEGSKTYAELFRKAGYFTTNNVKTDYQFHPPISAWDENNNQAHWRNRPDKNQPFFSVFNIMETHESRVWGNANKPILVDPESIELPPYYPDSEIIRRDMAIHYSNIIRMDSIVGTILAQLEEDDLMDNTIIFFYSDHGDALPRMKRWTYDSGLHVPLIVKFPDKRDAGTTNDNLVSFVDFAPTVLALAGLEVPDYMHGQPFLGNDIPAPREYIFASRDRMDPALDCIRTVRDKRYKYHRNYMPQRPYVQFLPYRDQMGLMQELFRFRDEEKLNPVQKLWFSQTKPAEELYDTENDPHEINNLAEHPDYQNIKNRLSAELDKWIEETNDPLTLPEPELVKRLWPPDGIQPQTQPALVTEVDGVLKLKSETGGASIVYQLNENIGGAHWQLYTAPIPGDSVDSIATAAIRTGFLQSTTTAHYNYSISHSND
jgi:N-sulfoglucosamine sulfohydrolase